MNPYLNVARKGSRAYDYIRLFVEELGKSAQHHAMRLSSK